MKDGRKHVIEAATQAVMTDRNTEYAPPEQNFQRIADLWNTYLEGRTITPYDTAIMMILVKVARAMTSPHQVDHVVDIAGYAACAADVAPSAPHKDMMTEDEEVDEGTPLRYNGEEGRLFAPTDPDHDYMVWLSIESGKKARMTVRQWDQAIDAGAATLIDPEISE